MGKVAWRIDDEETALFVGEDGGGTSHGLLGNDAEQSHIHTVVCELTDVYCTDLVGSPCSRSFRAHRAFL
jgi:hypothetical protein